MPGLTFCPGLSYGQGSSAQQLLGSESASAHPCQPVQAPLNSPRAREVGAGISGTSSSLCISPAEAGPAGSLLGELGRLADLSILQEMPGLGIMEEGFCEIWYLNLPLE